MEVQVGHGRNVVGQRVRRRPAPWHLVVAAAVLALLGAACGTPPTTPGDQLAGPPSVEPTELPGGALRYPAIRYGAASGVQVLDLYRPAGPGPYPVVVWYHGGYWTQGSRHELPAGFRDALLGAGYAVATVEYRLSELVANKWPVQVKDAKLAVRYLQAHAGALALDGGSVFTSGFSAGGHLALMVAAGRGVSGQTLTIGDPVVQGAFSFGAPVDLRHLMANNPLADAALRMLLECGFDGWCSPDAAEPWRHLDPADPDLLLVSGGADVLVPPLHADRMATAATDVGFAGLSTTTLAGVGHDELNAVAPPSTFLPWLQART